MQEPRDSKTSDPSDCELGQGHHSKAVLWQAQVVHDTASTVVEQPWSMGMDKGGIPSLMLNT